jgi:hypothetical protein
MGMANCTWYNCQTLAWHAVVLSPSSGLAAGQFLGCGCAVESTRDSGWVGCPPPAGMVGSISTTNPEATSCSWCSRCLVARSWTSLVITVLPVGDKNTSLLSIPHNLATTLILLAYLGAGSLLPPTQPPTHKPGWVLLLASPLFCWPSASPF